MTTGFEISWEAADDITLSNLKGLYKNLADELDGWIRGDRRMHVDDVRDSNIMLIHLNEVIEYYGGTV